MKHHLLTGLFTALFTVTAAGQTNRFDIGVQGSPSVSLLWGNSYAKKYSKPTVGFSAGITFRYNLPKYLSVGTDITFEREGNLTKSDATDSEGNVIGEIVATIRLDYLTIPVLAKFSIGNKIKFFFNAGPHFGYLIAASAAWDVPSQFSSVPPITDQTDNFKRFDIGLTTGLGLTVPVTSKFLISAEVRNNLGLYNISNYPVADGGTIQTNSTHLLIGAAYLLGQRKE